MCVDDPVVSAVGANAEGVKRLEPSWGDAAEAS